MRTSFSICSISCAQMDHEPYNERLSNSGVHPTRGSRLLPPYAHLASATSTSSTSKPRSAALSYPPGHQTIATAPSCSSFSSPWDRWCLKRFSASNSQPRVSTVVLLRVGRGGHETRCYPPPSAIWALPRDLHAIILYGPKKRARRDAFKAR